MFFISEFDRLKFGFVVLIRKFLIAHFKFLLHIVAFFEYLSNFPTTSDYLSNHIIIFPFYIRLEYALALQATDFLVIIFHFCNSTLISNINPDYSAIQQFVSTPLYIKFQLCDFLSQFPFKKFQVAALIFEFTLQV